MDTTRKTTLLNGQGLTDNDIIVNSADLVNLKGPRIYPLSHLSCLTITGKDTAKLLQGQLTCNVNEISESKSNFTAMCNAKGRAIATFLLAKKADAFLIILPDDLLETVKRKLQLYVLRSDVKITDSTDGLCLLGLSNPAYTGSAFTAESQDDILFVNLPGKQGRKLLIADADNGLRFWSEQTGANGVSNASAEAWRYLDIVSGLPWVTAATSEEFIPQMLNLDKLGGISFNKGCYTGQEIVARTHYLGKAKRGLFLAACKSAILPAPNSNVIRLGDTEPVTIGKVLQSQSSHDDCIMQVVLQTGETEYGDLVAQNLALQDDALTPIKIVPFHS